ncbi:mechanosensitive ion channel family protein [Quadrisphaera sp. DSM 44207]|uniref:mechanosensitive ion channel family protein n=1 Tax=Quadrisphaera sp. DSM 44207 TaxID=1881057 RepID=UPI000890AE3A|nr:mechanosensitive ion channel family protein [Quadrisphaera sp. DSM 44207]SDQ06277.1 small conductance mechanosensitive channel [Quadrisphaera sp. DSM 44207]
MNPLVPTATPSPSAPSAPSTPSTPSATAAGEPTVEEQASALDEAQDRILNPCFPGDGSFCGRLRAWGVDETVARDLTGYGVGLLQIVVIVAGGLLARWLLHRAISRLTEQIATGEAGIGRWSRRSAGAAAPAVLDAGAFAGERRAQRARTVGSVLRSTTTAGVTITAVLLVLGVFGVDLGPLIAGAGVLGVALGFGSQTLVKDFLSGLFLILEDQYGVGDVVDLGDAVGSVEAVGLRVTRVRSVDGTVWYVRNGEILRVGNQSQGWARAVLDVNVAYGEDVARVRELLREVAHEFTEDEEWRHLVLEEPEVWGVEALAPGAVVVRLVVKTVPLEQWNVAREMRQRIKARFDAEGVEIPFPQQTVWLRGEQPAPAPAPAPTPARTP